MAVNDMASLVELDSVEILVIVDNEVTLSQLDPISPCPNEVVQQTGGLKEIGIFGTDITDRGEAKKELRMDSICCGAHGLALLITGIAGDRRHTILFDTGPEEAVFEHNAKRLKAPLGDIEAIQLSHWHRDHSGGMLRVLSMANAARESGAAPISVDLHPARPDYRGVMAMAPVSLEADPTFEEIEFAGGKVEKHDEAHVVLDSFFMVSGEIPRTTEYEKGLRRGIRYSKATGKWESDEQMQDERSLMCKLKGGRWNFALTALMYADWPGGTGKGLVMFTGCSHAGVVNASRHALDLSTAPLYAVMGGYHMADGEPQFIEQTVTDLKALDPQILLTGHCTGWRAKFEIQSQMPGRIVPSFVGSKFVL
ncbi:hypothetical protein LTR53_005093 [Teratosphaeriaceae sp. CCFEE 6253]|nr:hypothetical protein LTR53_005093 [Teratosphaeriaceae sp. CCFEE 6253]